ncbi:hypothetical protein Zmor_013089 [Zophobas morio]|uniref:Myosin motor domain-containing protein n=1 Tax=Zophobas morio TaxID=2755281 RepID=A0AA38MEV7_9CUCU|nr:hypothetical protein Zmor_013089 [Zophobas morio]
MAKIGRNLPRKVPFKITTLTTPLTYTRLLTVLINTPFTIKFLKKILLGGESGSGKTRTYLDLINHLLFLGHNNNINLERIRGGIKLIHSLTHASTPINNYSTRCVFKTDIKYGTTGKVSGAVFNAYQLEKWRVSSVEIFQGNYHFLYYVYDGLRENKKLDQYHLNPDRQYRYLQVDTLSNTNSPKFNVNQNLTKLKKLLKIFEDLDLGYDEMDTIFSIVAAILVTGEVRFQETETRGAVVENVDAIEKIGQLLKIDPRKFEWALTNCCFVGRGTADAVRKRSTVDEARDARDVFANNLYARLVDYLVGLVNSKLSAGVTIFGEKYSVQIIYYFGFECIRTNHLAQHFVNCFNEQLQYHYLQRLFSWEYLDTKEKELEYQPLGYYDNKKTLDQLLGKPEGLFCVIDDASKTGRDAKYITDCLQDNAKEFITVVGTSDFSVSHYTGKVTYYAAEMPDKNRDFLPPEVTETLRLSDNPTVKMLFTNKLDKTGNLKLVFDDDETSNRRYKFQSDKATTYQYSQIRRMQTCIQTFKALSLEILKELSIGSGFGGTHFVRCIRTNLTNEPQNFDYQLVKQQVRALAVTETTKARQWGYSHRIPFQEFLRRYQFLAFDFNEAVDVNKENCRLLLVRLKMEGWGIGKSKVIRDASEEIVKRQSNLRRFFDQYLVAKRITVTEKSEYQEERRMTEEEAAAIIQKAYREFTIRKSYPDFAKDYKILDEETCNFIRDYAKKWRRSSLFHVLVFYWAFYFQEMYNFSQQVHLYNIGVFYNLQQNGTQVPLESIDSKAQVANWLETQNSHYEKYRSSWTKYPSTILQGCATCLPIRSTTSINKCAYVDFVSSRTSIEKEEM